MKNTSEYVVQTLIDDEDMSADLASLYPAASKIGDAAAAFIDKADQTIEKKGLMGTPAGTVAKCIDICQNVVKEARPSAGSYAIQGPATPRSSADGTRKRITPPKTTA